MSATMTEQSTTLTTIAGDLVLVRLLPATKKPSAPSQVRKDLYRFFRNPLTDEHWQATIDALTEAGLLASSQVHLTKAGRPRKAKPTLRLTDAGRSHALEFLGISQLPARCNWGGIQTKFLVPKALGFAPNDDQALKKTAKADGLAAVLLARRFDLPQAASTADEVLQALVCREIGFPNATTLNEVKLVVLSRFLHYKEPLSDGDVKKLPQVLLGAPQAKIEILRGVLFQGWTDPPGKDTTEFDLSAFARTVKAASRDCPTGRFGDNKVFISHVWRRLHDEPGFPIMDLPAFKERLTEANAERLLTLSRADLPHVMDAESVRDSLTRYLNSEYHFVLVEKEQP